MQRITRLTVGLLLVLTAGAVSLGAVEIGGGFDILYLNYLEESDLNGFSLGELEAEFEHEFAEGIEAEFAIAYECEAEEEPEDTLAEAEEAVGEFEIEEALVNFLLFGEEEEEEEDDEEEGGIAAGLIVGKFDVPFGIDYKVAAPIDRKLVSAPLVVEETHGGWNDIGLQGYGDFGFANLAAYGLNGSIDEEASFAIGTRVGITPLEFLEVGGSYAAGLGDAETSLMGVDLWFGIAGFELKGEFIIHDEASGFYAQALYGIGPVFAVGRYSTFEDESQITAGAGLVILEGVETRLEYQMVEDANRLALQLVAGF